VVGGTAGGGTYGGGPFGELGESACAGVMDTAWITGTVHATATPTVTPRLSRSRRVGPTGAVELSSIMCSSPDECPGSPYSAIPERLAIG
jgi:hypothetical protein